MTIAAENGNATAQYNLWFELSRTTEPLDFERGLFWLRLSARAGHERAKQVLFQREAGGLE
jgi:TPR repeat protein